MSLGVTVNIRGGIVTANGGINKDSSEYEGGAGIGGGAGYGGTGGGAGDRGTGGTVTISGGTVTANGQYGAAGIGGGTYGTGGTFVAKGNAFIIATSIQDEIYQNEDSGTQGIIFDGTKTGSIYGKPHINRDTTIPVEYSLTVGEGKSIEVDSGVTLTNNGTLTLDGDNLEGGGMLGGNGIFTSKMIKEDISLVLSSDTYIGNDIMPTYEIMPTKKILNKEFTVMSEGYEQSFQKKSIEDTWNMVENIKNAGLYRLVFEKVDHEISKEFTIAKAEPRVAVSTIISRDGESPKVELIASSIAVGYRSIPTGTITFLDKIKGTAINLEGTDINDEGIATYMWEGLVDGDYEVEAIYSENENYNSTKSTKVTFNTRKQSQGNLILDSIGNKVYGDSLNLSTTGGSGDGVITYEIDNKETASIDGGLITIKKPGNITITATKAADDDYNEATTLASLTIGKKLLNIKADNQRVYKNGAITDLKYTVIGLVGDDEFTGPTITTRAKDTNTVGDYDIDISGGEIDNASYYTVTYTNGTLNIRNRPTPVDPKPTPTPIEIPEGNDPVIEIPTGQDSGEDKEYKIPIKAGDREKEITINIPEEKLAKVILDLPRNTPLPQINVTKGDVSAVIPKGIKITNGDSSSLELITSKDPKDEKTINKIKATIGNKKDFDNVEHIISMGGSSRIEFDDFISLTFKGSNGKDAAYIENGQLYIIEKFESEEEGRKSGKMEYAYYLGNDLIVKTKHCTDFLVYGTKMIIENGYQIWQEILETKELSKSWTVKLNMPLDESTVNESSVYILDEKNQKLNFITPRVENEKEIGYVKLNNDGSFEINKTYCIVIEDNVKSTNRKGLKYGLKIKFIVK